MPKPLKSSLPPWMESVEGLAACERILRKLLEEMSATDYDSMEMIRLTKEYRGISVDLDRKLLTDLQARKLVKELADETLLGMREDELEKMFLDNAHRRGLRNVEVIRREVRDGLREMFQSAGIPMTHEQLMQMAKSLVKVPKIHPKGKDLAVAIEHTFDRMNAQLERGHDAIQESLGEVIDVVDTGPAEDIPSGDPAPKKKPNGISPMGSFKHGDVIPDTTAGATVIQDTSPGTAPAGTSATVHVDPKASTAPKTEVT